MRKRTTSLSPRWSLKNAWVGITLCLFIVVSLIWRVNQIVCIHPSRSCTEAERSALEPQRHQRILFQSSPRLAQVPELASLGVSITDSTLKWPATRVVYLADQELVFGFRIEENNWGVTSSGLVIPVVGTPQFRYSIPMNLADRWEVWQLDPTIKAREVQVVMQLLPNLPTSGVREVVLQDEQTLIVVLENQRVLLDPRDWQVGWQRWETLEKHFDWQEIPEKIQEIDVRYRLPVLRSFITLPRHIV